MTTKISEEQLLKMTVEEFNELSKTITAIRRRRKVNPYTNRSITSVVSHVKNILQTVQKAEKEGAWLSVKEKIIKELSKLNEDCILAESQKVKARNIAGRGRKVGTKIDKETNKIIPGSQ